MMFPMQPIVKIGDVVRFQANRIVRDLLDRATAAGLMDLNSIALTAAHGSYTIEEQMQFAQLIGYSVSGYGELSYATSVSIIKADRAAAKLTKRKRPCSSAAPGARATSARKSR